MPSTINYNLFLHYPQSFLQDNIVNDKILSPTNVIRFHLSLTI